MSVPAGGEKKNIVKMAYIYFQEGRWDKAIEEYKKLLALDPEDFNTHNMLGDVYVRKGASREAFEEYIKVSADFSSRGQTDKAAIVNKKIAALDSSLLPVEAQKKQDLIKQTLKAETAIERGDVDTAISALSEVLKMDQENLTAFYKLGELLEKKGQFEQAVQQYRMLGNAFLKNRLYKKAQEVFQKIVQLAPDDTEAHINLAQIYIKQGSEGDAKKEYLNAAEKALATGDMDKAFQFGTKAVELKSIEAHYILGMVFFMKQQLSDAKAQFESLLRFKVNHVGALTHLGRVHLELNQVDKASEYIQKALKLEKDNPIVLEAWVEVCLKKGNRNEAINALITLTNRSLDKKDWAKAAEFARSVSSLDETSTVAYGKLAEALKQNGDKHESAEVYVKMALLYEKQNKKEAVLEAAQRALELNPTHAEAGRLAGVEPMASPGAKPAEEAKSKEKISSVTPQKPEPSPTAVMDLEEEVLSSPAEIHPPATLSAVPSVPEEDVKPNESEGDLAAELKAQISIAENYARQGQVEDAIEIYQQLIESHPDHPELKEKLNLAYRAYVKSGEDVIGVLEEEKKAKEEEEKHLRAEMEKKAKEEAKRLREELEQKARLEAEKQARFELEKKAREEAEKLARAEVERIAREEAEKRNLEDNLRKAREEAEKKIKETIEIQKKEEADRKTREEAERKAWDEAERKAREISERKSREEVERLVKEEIEKKIREEADHKAREESQRKAEEERKKTPLPSWSEPSAKDSVLDEGRDEFMTIEVADIYVRSGLYEEAAKIYRRIVQTEPANMVAKRKMTELETLIKSKGGNVEEKVSPHGSETSPATGATSAPHPTPPVPSKTQAGGGLETPETQQKPVLPEKDSSGKKKPNRVGYV